VRVFVSSSLSLCQLYLKVQVLTLQELQITRFNVYLVIGKCITVLILSTYLAIFSVTVELQIWVCLFLSV